MEILFIIIPVFLAFVIWGAIHSHKKEQERKAALRAFATQHGLYFHDEKVRGFDREHAGFSALRQGQNRYAYNIVAGKLNGYDSKLFDYHYETKSQDSKGNTTTHHHHFSAVILECPFLLRPIEIRPEGIWDKAKAAFGWDDIDFESAEFSRRYFVKCSDKRWAYDVIHGRIMEMLLEVKGYSFQTDTHSMLCRESGRFTPGEFTAAHDLARTILDEIPQHAKERASYPHA